MLTAFRLPILTRTTASRSASPNGLHDRDATAGRVTGDAIRRGSEQRTVDAVAGQRDPGEPDTSSGRSRIASATGCGSRTRTSGYSSKSAAEEQPLRRAPAPPTRPATQHRRRRSSSAPTARSRAMRGRSRLPRHLRRPRVFEVGGRRENNKYASDHDMRDLRETGEGRRGRPLPQRRP